MTYPNVPIEHRPFSVGVLGTPEGRMPLHARGLWRTEDGRIIPIRELEDGHLVNCMKLKVVQAVEHLMKAGYLPTFRFAFASPSVRSEIALDALLKAGAAGRLLLNEYQRRFPGAVHVHWSAYEDERPDAARFANDKTAVSFRAVLKWLG
jgi:hypothetical protein